VARELEPPAQTPAPSKELLYERAARVGAGLADAVDRELLAEAGGALRPELARIQAAVAAAMALPANEPTRYRELWPAIEPRLR
jgi:hypothetical protein